MTRTIIGLTGLKGSGKDTFASELCDSYSFSRLAFAQPLKAMMYMLLINAGMNHKEIEEALNGEDKEKPLDVLCGRTARHAMQTLGTEWRNTINKDLWVKMLLSKINRSSDSNIVITDVRFPHEADALRELGAKIVRIIRPGIYASNHPSESQIIYISVDYEIINNLTINDLNTQSTSMLRSLGVSI